MLHIIAIQLFVALEGPDGMLCCARYTVHTIHLGVVQHDSSLNKVLLFVEDDLFCRFLE